MAAKRTRQIRYRAQPLSHGPFANNGNGRASFLAGRRKGPDLSKLLLHSFVIDRMGRQSQIVGQGTGR